MRADEVGAERGDQIGRQVVRPDQAGPDRIVDVVVDVGDEVRDAHDLSFDRARADRRRHADRRARLPFRVLRDAVADFPREVQAPPVVLQDVDDAEALLVVVEASGHQAIDDPLARVTEWRVSEIVAERDGFGELFVQAQHLGDRARDLRHLEGVREPRAVVVAGRREEDLRLVFEPAEGLAVDDAIAIALKCRPDVVLPFRPQPAARVGALRRLRREGFPLPGLELLTQRAGAGVISITG